jgi:hypothetical protein
MRQVSLHAELNAISDTARYAMHYSRSHDAVIRVYDDAGNVIATHEQGRFQGTMISFFNVVERCPRD